MEKLENEKKNFVVEFFRPAWNAHLWLEDKLKIYGAYTLLIVPFLVFVLVAQLDYANNRKKKDISALSPKKIELYNVLIKKDIELSKESSRHFNNAEFASYKETEKQRNENWKQLSVILDEAPSKSWAYRMYVALGIIKG